MVILYQPNLPGGARAAGYTDLYVAFRCFFDYAGRPAVESLECHPKTTMGLELVGLHLLRVPPRSKEALKVRPCPGASP